MRFSEKNSIMKGQLTPEEAFELFFTVVIVVIAIGFAWTMFQDTSDNYVEREKYENAQSKISELQGTIDDQNQRIDNLQDWKENYSEVKQENERLEEQLNQSENPQEPKNKIEPPNINIDIEYPWGASAAAMIALIIGIITPTSVVGIKGYFKLPVPETVATIIEDEEDTENEEQEEESG